MTIDDFNIGDVVIYFGVEALVKGYTWDPKTYEIDGIILDQGEVDDDDQVVVRPDNYKFLRKL